MEPWPAWDGKDFLDMPVLIKTKGKTTTDHISPAGPWLRYRGHLDKFSDNMFMGAINAFTGEAGKGINVLTGEKRTSRSPRSPATTRRRASSGWSSATAITARAAAASTRRCRPRLLGGVAVIARSFARIHESNLKKQGLLALTFQDPADYDRIRADDRISLVGLEEMAPGKPVECRIKHADGSDETLKLNHTFSASQLEWFRKGSALNLFHHLTELSCRRSSRRGKADVGQAVHATGDTPARLGDDAERSAELLSTKTEAAVPIRQRRRGEFGGWRQAAAREQAKGDKGPGNAEAPLFG